MTAQDPRVSLFDELVTANRRRILAIARTYAPAGESSDLCQEILLQMWRALAGFRGESAPSTWVYRIALNTAITYRRRNRRRLEPHCIPLDQSRELEAPSDPGRQVLVLEEFLRALGKIDRAIFLLYLEDLSYRDIADITGLSEGHVGVRINRLRNAFRRLGCGEDHASRRKVEVGVAQPDAVR